MMAWRVLIGFTVLSLLFVIAGVLYAAWTAPDIATSGALVITGIVVFIFGLVISGILEQIQKP